MKPAQPLLLAAWLAACSLGATAAPEFSRFSSSGPGPAFTIEHPQWSPRKSGNRFNVLSLMRSDKQCYFDLDQASVPIDQYRGIVRGFMQKQGASIQSADPLSYEFQTPDGKYTFEARTRGMDCGEKSYLATMTCLQGNFDQATAEHAFGSMRCGGAQAQQIPMQTGARPQAGMVVSTAGKFTAKTVQQAYDITRDGGASLTRFYVFWPSIEKHEGARDWKGTDYMMNVVRQHHLRLSVAFHTIRTAVRGPMPEDLEFRGWTDPALVSRFGDFALAFIDRYSDLIDYVEIGSEVNAYFSRHPDEISDYRSFFQSVKARIARRFPDVKVGMVFAFHEMRDKGDFSVYEKLRVGDFDGFTLYLYGDGFQFDREPREVFEALQQMADVTGQRPFAVEEVGWSPWPSLGGTEAEQAAAVDAAFDYLEQAPGRMLFLNWFNLHDGREQDCDRMARTFVKAGDAMSRNAEAMQRFSDFLCHLGLRANDGQPRAGWEEWVRRAKALRGK